jgi:hypothetical protein
LGWESARASIPNDFQLQADGKSPAPKGNLEDDEVLEVAREAGSGI